MSDPREEDLVRWDETLLEAGEELPAGQMPDDPDLRRELLRQRFAHALLVATHERDRTGARERRVQSIVRNLGPLPASGRVFHIRPWLSLAAALVVAGGITAYVVSRDNESLLANDVDDVIDELGTKVDRSYRLRVEQRREDGSFELCGRHTLTVRPGKVRLSLEGERVGRWELGCDGTEIWRHPAGDQGQLQFVPMARADELLRDLLDSGLVALGYLDLGRVLESIPDDSLREVAEPIRLAPEDGLVREIQVEGPFRYLEGTVRGLSMLIDTDSDEVRRLAFLLDNPARAPERKFRLTFKYEGELPPSLAGDRYYARPTPR